MACYGNGRDILNGEPLRLEAGAGAGQMQQIYRALARIDTKQKTADFADCFERELLNAPPGTTTVFVSPNAYDGFLSLLERFRREEPNCIWFYPLSKTEKHVPELPENWKTDVILLCIDGSR